MQFHGADTSRRIVTALDVVMIVGLATTIVMVLGVRERFLLGPVLVSLRDPLRPLLVAGVACLLRWFVGRTQPILPSISRSDIHQQLETERARVARPELAAHGVKYYALAAAAASLVWLAPHIGNIRDVPDPYDPLLSAWRLARFAHQLVRDPVHLFDGNIYHPSPDTLTYSDATILEGLVAFPFVVAGIDPLVVSNALVIASFPMCAVAFFFTAWRLTSDAQAACIAGILGGLAAFKTLHYNHLELQFFCFAPLAVLAVLRLAAAPSWRTGAWLGGIITAQWLACMYFGVMLFVFLAPVAVLAIAAWRPRPTQALLAALATSSLIIAIGFGLVAIPFMRGQAEHGGRSIEQVRSFSAIPRSYATEHRFLATYGVNTSGDAYLQEAALFPGSLTLALGALGIAPPVSLATLALTAGTAIAFEGSLGTNGLIYGQLYQYVAPFRGMRVPARFAAFVTTGLVLLAGFGARRVLRLGRTRTLRAVIFIGLMTAALIDLRPDLPLEPYPRLIPSIYSAVTPDMVLAELPMDGRANFSFMYFSTFHRARLINGESGHFPPGYASLTEDMAFFPERNLLDRLRGRGATHLTVNCGLFSRPQRCAALLQAIDVMPELELVSTGKWEGKEARLYAIR